MTDKLYPMRRGGPWDQGYMSIMDSIMNHADITPCPYPGDSDDAFWWDIGVSDAWNDETLPDTNDA